MNGRIVISLSDLALESAVLGFFLFTLVFFFLAWRKFSSKSYLSILLIGIITSVHSAAGIAAKIFAVVLGSPMHAGSMIVLQELCILFLLAAIPYFWGCFLERPTWFPRFNRMLSAAGLLFSLGSAVVAVLRPDLFLNGFSGGSWEITYRSGVLYPVTRAPIGLMLLYSGIVILVDSRRWRVLNYSFVLIAGNIVAVIFGFSSYWKTFTGFYLDPLYRLHFSRIAAALSAFGLSISYGFIKHFLGDALQVKLTHDRLDAAIMTDDLTGLPNRRALMRDLGKAITAGSSKVLILADIDGFNDLNEYYGSETGDAVLRSISGAFLPLMPEGGSMYRLESDEFAMLFPCASRACGGSVTEMLKNRLRAGVEIGGERYPLDASFSILLVPEDGTNPETLLTMSYSCLRDAKREPDGIRLFSKSWHEEALYRIETVRTLRSDLAAGRFHLEYQPIHGREGAVTSAEVLLRWDAVERRSGPAEFIPIAESAGLVKEIGSLVIEMLNDDLGERLRKPSFPCMSVNLSPIQLADTRCMESLRARVKSLGIGFEQFQWEVTETVLLDRDSSAVSSLGLLRKEGSTIAIDDFGSGYSNLGYLHTLPVDKLKMDKSFLRAVPGSRTAEFLVRSLTGIGTALRLSLLAEGVESAEQFEFLKNAGFLEFQGYHFSHPLLRDDFLAYVEEVGVEPYTRLPVN